jgi:hypothetical protein
MAPRKHPTVGEYRSPPCGGDSNIQKCFDDYISSDFISKDDHKLFLLIFSDQIRLKTYPNPLPRALIDAPSLLDSF